MDYKIFTDAIHGPMAFHPLVVVVADTPQIQRLRNIKQLGACSFVFPCATHTRFEHSLGTAFIAGKLFDSIKQKGIPSGMTDSTWDKLKLCAEIAGLCHDAGHGPFSHFWEVFRHRCNVPFNHEEESIKIFEEILTETPSPSKLFNGAPLDRVEDVFSFYNLTSEFVQLIKNMILGRKNENNFLFQVIANKTNDVDVDKWDYIARDSLMLNVPVAFDLNRLLNFCRVLRDENGQEQICFRDKECTLLVEMFLARGKLHDSGYQHVKVKIVEEMLLDAFILAKDRLKLIETPITQLTDHIYHKILFEDYGNDENMIKAKKIIQRLERRHLYKLLGSMTHQTDKKLPSFNEILLELCGIPDLKPYLHEIGVTRVSIDMTASNKKKGLKNVLVYSKVNGQDCSCRSFDWDKHHDFLKHNLGSLTRNQLFLLYKGDNLFPDSLIPEINKKLRLLLSDKEQK